MKYFARNIALPIALFALVLAGCGGKGTSPSVGQVNPASTTISGTAASGAPIANTSITITGAAGGTVTATTGPDGKYTADVSSLTAPYLLKITTAGGDFYSVGNAAGTVNIHQFTDLIIRTYYKVQGTTVDVAFADPTATNNAPPSAEVVKTISAVVEEIIGLWLTNNGIDPATFDLITTPFTAGSAATPAAGLDTVLANSTVTTGGVVTITVGTTIQTTTVAVDAATNTTTTTTTVSLDSGATTSSSSFTSVVVAADAATQAAVAGVLATLSNLSTTINTKGSALAGADLLPYYDAAYVGDGLTGTQDATGFAADVAGATFNAFTVDRVLKFDTVNNIISIAGIATITQNGVTATQGVSGEEGWVFRKQANGSWLMYGNQQRARARVNVTTTRNRSGMNCTSGCDGIYYTLQIQLGAPTGTVTSATVAGLINGFTQTLNLTKQSGTFLNNGISTEHFDLQSTPGQSAFYQLTSPANFPPAGTVYTLVVTFADATQQTYTRVLGAATSEAFDLQANVEATVGHSVATALGTPITLSWNLPTTFSISEVYAYGFVKNINGVGCDVQGPQLATNATTVTMTLPTTCGGAAVDTSLTNGVPSINIVVGGSGGQRSEIWYGFQLP